MRPLNQGCFRQQVQFLRRQFLQDGDLPFTDVLTEEAIAQALATVTGWLDRIFSPLVTLWVFLGQVLSADHSCRGAVARLIAHRLSRGQRPCSPETGAYCQARKRLPEECFSNVARQTGRALETGVDPTAIPSDDHSRHSPSPPVPIQEDELMRLPKIALIVLAAAVFGCLMAVRH